MYLCGWRTLGVKLYYAPERLDLDSFSKKNIGFCIGVYGLADAQLYRTMPKVKSRYQSRLKGAWAMCNPKAKMSNFKKIETALNKKVRHPAYTHYLLGHALESDNKFIEARAEYRRALVISPNWRDAVKRIKRINISWPE